MWSCPSCPCGVITPTNGAALATNGGAIRASKANAMTTVAECVLLEVI